MKKNSLKCSALVVKIASRCNLNCTYCYMYNMGDQSYLGQPKLMSEETVTNLLHRIKNHCDLHNIEKFWVIFHGGEPLLAGPDFIRNFVESANMVLADVEMRFAVQTNGILLTKEFCELFHELNITIGISLDGTPERNDKYRINHAGKGSYDEIVKGVEIAKNSPLKDRLGTLCVVDASSDPLATYNHFRELDIYNIDFLLPDSNYETPPPLKPQNSIDNTPYADWLITIFDQWYEDGRNRINVRIFDDIINLILGKDITSEVLGSSKNEVLVIETDSSIESVDVLKICGNGFTKDKANVLHDELDEALKTDLATKYNLSHKQLAPKCENCLVKDICGGGYLPHRYKQENQFDNPSIYCSDLMKLITHIQNKVLAQLPKELLEEAGVEMLTYEDAQKAFL